MTFYIYKGIKSHLLLIRWILCCYKQIENLSLCYLRKEQWFCSIKDPIDLWFSYTRKGELWILNKITPNSLYFLLYQLLLRLLLLLDKWNPVNPKQFMYCFFFLSFHFCLFSSFFFFFHFFFANPWRISEIKISNALKNCSSNVLVS